jgi:hypothetical protein
LFHFLMETSMKWLEIVALCSGNTIAVWLEIRETFS